MDREMNNDITIRHRNEILERIVDRTIIELEQKNIEVSDLPKIGDFVLSNISEVKDHSQLLVHLEELVQQWPGFVSILNMEKAEIEQSKEDGVAEKVLRLSKEGKIEEALALARTITKK